MGLKKLIKNFLKKRKENRLWKKALKDFKRKDIKSRYRLTPPKN